MCKQTSCWLWLKAGSRRCVRRCFWWRLAVPVLPWCQQMPRCPFLRCRSSRLLAWLVELEEATPTFKLCPGVMGEGVISPLFPRFLSPFGWCFFAKAPVQTAPLGACLSFVWVRFWLAFRGQRGMVQVGRRCWRALSFSGDETHSGWWSSQDTFSLFLPYLLPWCCMTRNKIGDRFSCWMVGGQLVSRTFPWPALIGKFSWLENVLLGACLWILSPV